MARTSIVLNDPRRFDELKKCCLFQLADEQRHLEMDTEVWQRAGIPERDWLPAWEAPGTPCRFFRHVLELEDSFEILVKANFVAEGAAGDEPSNLDVIQRWQDESLQLFREVARNRQRQAWWEGFLASYYKIALPLGLRRTAL